MTYALGRGLDASDMPMVRRIVRESASNHYQLSDLIVDITKSIPFQMRRAAAPAPMVTAQ
jgi:hypothetical protein